MKNAKRNVLFGSLVVVAVIFIIVSTFVMVTVFQKVKSNFSEIFRNENSRIVESSNVRDTAVVSLVGGVTENSKKTENVSVAYLSNSSANITWKFSSTDIRKGDVFKAYLNVGSSSTKVKVSDIGTDGIEVTGFSGSKGKYTITCKAAKTGKCVISYLPKRKTATINVKEALKIKTSWTISKSTIRKGDNFTVGLEMSNLPKGFKLSPLDVGTYGITIKKISGKNGKYTIECLANETGEKLIGYIPTGDTITINVKKKSSSAMSVSWDAPLYVAKGQYFVAEVTVTNPSSKFKMNKKDIATYGIKVCDIKQNGNKYLVICQVTTVGDLVLQYAPTKDSVTIKST